MSESQSDDDVVLALQPYGACDVADALLRLEHRYAGFLPGLRLRCPDQTAKLVGRVFTVQWKASHPDEPVAENYTGHYIDHVPPGTILFSSVGLYPMTQCIIGGLMALRLSKIGAKGAIVDGRIRDLAELRATGLPIFSRDIGISAANSIAYPAEIGVPVKVHLEESACEVVESGDIVVGDENGVAHIPRHLEQEVLELLPKLKAQDEKVREAIEEGQTAAEAFKLRTIK